MAGKSYIKTGGQWVLIKGMYVKVAGFWTTIQKGYIKVSGTWTKMFDSASTAPSISGTNPAIRLHSYRTTGYETVGSQIQMGPGSNYTPAETIADGESGTTYLWGYDGVWVNDVGAVEERNFFQNSTNDTNTWSIDGNTESTGDKYANTANKIWWADAKYLWYSLSKKLNNKTGIGISSPVFITKQPPSITSGYIENYNTVNVGVAKKLIIDFPFYWYNEVDMYNTYIEWFASTDTTNTNSSTVVLNNANRVRGPIYLSNKTYTTADDGIYSDGSTSRSGTSGWHQAYRYTDNTRLYGSDMYTPTASDVGKRLWAKITYGNSYTVKNSQTLTRADWSGLVLDAPPVGSGTPTFVRDETSYGYRIDSVGTWTGSPTSYRYAWYYRVATQFGSSYTLCTGTNATGTFTPAQLTAGTNPVFDATSFKPTNNTSGIYQIVAIVWASNANGESASGYPLYDYGTQKEESKGAISSILTTPKYKKPVISNFSVTAGTRKITYDANWTSDDPSATATISWTGQATGSQSALTGAGNLISNLAAGTYQFTLTVTNNGANAVVGSVTSVKSSIVVTAISTYSFSFGNTLYASTNGYISFDDTNNFTNVTSTTGRVLGIYPKDLVQGYDRTLNGQYYMLYWSNDSEYVIQWTGYEFGYTSDSPYILDPTHQLRYQVRFYKNQSYADIKYLIKGTNLTNSYNPAIYFDGAAVNNQYAGTISQGTSIRIYFDGSAPVTLSSLGLTFTEIAQQDMLDSGALTANRNASYPSDDAYKTLVTAINQFTAPTLSITTASVTASAIEISVPFTTGGAYSKYSIDVKTGGSSISGYPKINQTANPALITTVASTTYAITITPYNSSGNAGLEASTSKSTPAALGAFTYYAYDATAIPTKPVLTLTESNATANDNRVYWSWASTKPTDTASYDEYWWGSSITTDSATAGYSESLPKSSLGITTLNTYTYNSSSTYDEYWSSTYSGQFNAKVVANGSGTVTSGVSWTASTGAGSYKVNYTTSGATSGNGTFTSSSQTTTGFTKAMTAGGTLTVNSVTAYSTTDGTGTNTINATLQSGQVSAITPTQKTATSDTASLTVTSLPGYPTDLVLTAGDGKVDLSWTAPTSGTTVNNVLQAGGVATGYEWVSSSTSTEPTTGWTATTSTTASKSSLTNGTTYYFWVRSTNAAGYSGSNNGSKAPVSNKPAIPTFVVSAGSATSQGWIYVTSSNATTINFSVYRTASGGGVTSYGTVNTYALFDSGTFQASTGFYYLPRNGYYYIVATGTNTDGTGSAGYSNYVNSAIFGQNGTAANWIYSGTPISPTTASSAQGSVDGRIDITWTEAKQNFTGTGAPTYYSNTSTYEIFWNSSNVAPAEAATADFSGIPLGTTTYANTGLGSAITRWYWIRSRGYSVQGATQKIVGPWVSAGSATTKTVATVSAPGAPTISSVSGSGVVTWTAPTTGGAVASYEVQFYTASDSSGTNLAGPFAVTGISSSPYQLISPYGGANANYARARVLARNSGGASAYSSWAPSATTYA